MSQGETPHAVHAKKWTIKGKTRYQPRQGDIGLYRDKTFLLLQRGWREDFVYRMNPDTYEPVLYRSEARAVRAGRGFIRRHTCRHHHPVIQGGYDS